MELLLHFDGRPPTANRTRYSHWSKGAEETRRYREDAGWQCLRKPPFQRPVVVNAQPHTKDNRLADAGACFATVKAVIDGVVDAGLLPDDGPKYVVRYELEAPFNSGRDLLIVRISEVADGLGRPHAE